MALGRVATTHTGSLPRPRPILNLLQARDLGEIPEPTVFKNRLRLAVEEIVRKQAACGIDFVNDGELGKISYATYTKDRLAGLSAVSKPRVGVLPDLVEFPEYAERVMPRFSGITAPVCEGPISYRGFEEIRRDCEALVAAVSQVSVAGAFMTATPPGVIGRWFANQYYPTYEEYLFAIADAMKHEYDAIAAAGLTLQLDCPDLTGDRHAPGAKQAVAARELHIDALNYAVRDIPREQMRLHICWGNYEGPHHLDTPLRDIINTVLKAKPAAISIEAANPRHAHEWKVFEEVKIPDDTILIPGVIDTTTHFIEHPELIAERVGRFAAIVGTDRVIAGTDCGFATFAGMDAVDPAIAWAKLGSVVQGTRLRH